VFPIHRSPATSAANSDKSKPHHPKFHSRSAPFDVRRRARLERSRRADPASFDYALFCRSELHRIKRRRPTNRERPLPFAGALTVERRVVFAWRNLRRVALRARRGGPKCAIGWIELQRAPMFVTDSSQARWDRHGSGLGLSGIAIDVSRQKVQAHAPPPRWPSVESDRA